MSIKEQESQHPLTARRQFQATGQRVSRTQARLVTQWRHGCPAMRRSVCNAGASNGGRSLCQYIDTTRKTIDCATTVPL